MRESSAGIARKDHCSSVIDSLIERAASVFKKREEGMREGGE